MEARAVEGGLGPGPPGKPEEGRHRVLFVMNKLLPPSDHRMRYARQSPSFTVGVAAPWNGQGEPPALNLPIGEGAPPRDVVELVRFGRWLRRHRHDYDLVHFFAFKLAVVGPLVARAAGLPSVVTVTGLGRVFSDPSRRSRLLRMLIVPLMRVAFHVPRRILFQTRTSMDEAIAVAPRARPRMRLIRSAVPMASDPLPVEEGMRPRRVVWISRLMAAKGGEEVLAIGRLLHRHGLTLQVYGPAATGEDGLLAAIREADRAGVLEYHGEIPGQEIEAVCRDAVLLFLSRYGEGMPRILMEAGAAGAAVVAHDTPLTREVLAEGRGVLVADDSPEAVARAVLELFGSPNRFGAARVALHRHVREVHAMDRYVCELDESMSEAIEEARRRR